MKTTRRVRHDVADAAVLMVFSLSMSVGLAGTLALLARLG
jgi:hypothetical protein